LSTFEPTINAVGVGTNTEITVRFSQRINPLTITTDTILFQLLSPRVIVPATLSVEPDQMTVRITPDSPLVANTGYTLILLTSIQDLAGNNFSGSNQITFTTAANADTVAPTVVTVSPANNQLDVPVNGRIQIQFSEPLNTFTVADDTMLLTANGGFVEGGSTLNNNRDVLTFTPTDLFSIDTDFQIDISNVTDRVGNAVIPFSSSFTSSSSDVLDTTRPTLLSVIPANAASNVALSSSIVMTFTESLNAITIDSSTIRIRQLSAFTDISGEYTLSADGRTVTFTPTVPLAPSTNYQIILPTNLGLEDLVGNSYAGLFVVSSFSTTP